MATALSFLSGRQITDANGTPQENARLYHYRATTTTALTVWTNSGATVAHAQPVECDAGGFVPLIYIDDTFNWKVVVTDQNDVTLRTYDNLPATPADDAGTGFAPSLYTWVQVTSAASPVALTSANAGNAYECDTTSGNIEFDLPSAASVGNGKGFVFKKTAAGNSLIIDPSGTQTIDDVSTSLTITGKDVTIGIYSNGAEWYTVISYGVFRVINNLAEETAPDVDADFMVIYDASAANEKKVKLHLAGGTVCAIIEDQKAQNTAGGTFTSGADQVRTLNTTVYNRNSTITALSSNQFTIKGGRWEIEWSAPASSHTASHQTILRNITAGTDVARGTSEWTTSDTARGDVQTRSIGSSVVTLASATTFEIRHRCSVTRATDGFGTQANMGTEIYTRVIVRAA